MMRTAIVVVALVLGACSGRMDPPTGPCSTAAIEADSLDGCTSARCCGDELDPTVCPYSPIESACELCRVPWEADYREVVCRDRG